MKEIKDPENSIIYITDSDSQDRINFERVCLMNASQLRDVYKRNNFSINAFINYLQLIYNVRATDYIKSKIASSVKSLLTGESHSEGFYIPNLDVTVFLTDYTHPIGMITAVTGFHFGEEPDKSFAFAPITTLL